MFQCQCQLGPSSSLSHWRCCPVITQKTHVFEVTKNWHKKKSHYLWMKEKLCTRQIVHCLQRFDLSQLVQDLSSINLNDPWISSHFLGFPLDTGVFFCLTNSQRKKKTGEKCPFSPPVWPTQPVGERFKNPMPGMTTRSTIRGIPWTWPAWPSAWIGFGGWLVDFLGARDFFWLTGKKMDQHSTP